MIPSQLFHNFHIYTFASYFSATNLIGQYRDELHRMKINMYCVLVRSHNLITAKRNHLKYFCFAIAVNKSFSAFSLFYAAVMTFIIIYRKMPTYFCNQHFEYQRSFPLLWLYIMSNATWAFYTLYII